MSYALAILLACLTLLCIAVHDRLSMRRIEARRRVAEIAQETVEASEAIAARAHQRAVEQAERQHRLARETDRQAARAFVEAHREAAEAWHGSEPWRNG